MFARLANFLTGHRPPATGNGPLPNRRSVVATAAGDHLANPAEMLGNPLRNLTPANAADLLQAAMRGEWTRAQWLMYYVEQWDADVWTLVERRCAGLRQLDWTIRTDATAKGKDAALAERQRDYLHDLYAAIDNMREAVEFLALAKFRGYSHLAIGEHRFEPLDQWWWVRDGMYGPWHYNPDARTTNAAALADPIDPALYIIREEPRSLLWLAILKFLRASHNAKWWDQFCEIASRHGTVIIGPPNLTDEQAATFADRAAAIARGGSGVLENGSSVEHTGPEGAHDGAVWESRLRYLKEDLILAGTGGMLTALSQATGIGSGQADEQGAVWRTILRADSQDISEVLQRQFDAPRLRAEFPDQPILAWFELDTSETPSADTILDHAVKAAQADLAIDPEQLSERTGYTLTAAPATGDQPPATGSPIPNRADPLPPLNVGSSTLNVERSASSSDIAAALASALSIPPAWLAPVADKLAALAALPGNDPEIAAADLIRVMESVADTLPELYDRMGHDALAATLEAALGTAALAVLETGPIRNREYQRDDRGRFGSGSGGWQSSDEREAQDKDGVWRANGKTRTGLDTRTAIERVKVGEEPILGKDGKQKLDKEGNEMTRPVFEYRQGGQPATPEQIARAEEVKAPPGWENTYIATDPAAKIQAQGIDSKGRPQDRRSATAEEEAHQRQWAKEVKMAKDIGGMRANAAADRKAGRPEAHLFEIEDATAIRIGTEGETTGKEKSYGLTTLEGRHVAVSGNEVRISFVGKEAVEFDRVVRVSPETAKFVADRKEAAGDSGQLWPDVSNAKFNGYIGETAGGKEYTAKNFRTYHGTRLAMDAVMPHAGKPLTSKDKKAVIADALARASSFLNNTPAVAKKAYVNPRVWDLIGGIE